MCNLLVPVFVMSLIGFFTVFLPPHTGEKISLAVTVLLGFFFVQTIIANLVPKSQTTPILAYYVIGSLAISTANVAGGACVVALYNLPSDKEVPHWIAFWIIRVLGFVVIRSYVSFSHSDSRCLFKLNLFANGLHSVNKIGPPPFRRTSGL